MAEMIEYASKRSVPAPAQRAPLDDVLVKVTWRLIPFLCCLYLLNYLDRVNVGFAALQMTDDLHFSDAAYGLGAGIFFAGYFLFEVPSNLILERVGARRWIARIMITWGIVSTAMSLVNGVWSFYALRFLLGVAEAGFFPGIILYLTYWFPAVRRARTTALLFSASAVAGVIGGPLSTAILGLDGTFGLRGWRWLFLIEGMPSIFVGFLVLRFLPDRPAQARWLAEGERDLLAAALANESAPRHAGGAAPAHAHFATALRDGRLWLLGAVYFALMTGMYTVSYWMPKLIKASSGLDNRAVGLATVVPFGAAVAAMILVSRHSDRTRERRRHVAACVVVAAIGLAAVPFCHAWPTCLAAFSLAAAGIWSAVPLFWSVPPTFLRGTAAAGGIAAINSLGNLGGFFGPSMIGALKTGGSNYAGGLWVVAGALLIGATLILLVPPERFEVSR